VRHCRETCAILQFVPLDERPCPILDLKKTRKQSEWYFVKDGKKLYPLCEEKGSKTGKKGVLML
jgi:hypothetical protein